MNILLLIIIKNSAFGYRDTQKWLHFSIMKFLCLFWCFTCTVHYLVLPLFAFDSFENVTLVSTIFLHRYFYVDNGSLVYTISSACSMETFGRLWRNVHDPSRVTDVTIFFAIHRCQVALSGFYTMVFTTIFW